MKIFKKAILPKGFKASGISCGIKKSGKLDLALFYSSLPAYAAGLFTTNKMPAAPVILCKSLLRKNNVFKAVIANSGNANCFNGINGLKDANATVGILAKYLDLKKESLLVASTGIIGRRLPVEKIKSGIPKLVKDLSYQGIDEAKKAIMTTDTFAKEVTVKFEMEKETLTICGIAKGAGMIAPDMATLLVFILTDANIAKSILKRSLRSAVEKSFNSITVDGCMSTNDSVILLANAAARNAKISSSKAARIFNQALELVCIELAKMIVRDGEGASKFIQIKVKEAKNFNQARKTALAIANSNLFKTAIYGENHNFGRIVAAIGASGVNVAEKDLKIKVSPLSEKDIFVEIGLKQGDSSAIVYTSDLTPRYIKINAEYN
jgi:glutamate N-acetyltransferase/amino-acid N-acetyltransferase